MFHPLRELRAVWSVNERLIIKSSRVSSCSDKSIAYDTWIYLQLWFCARSDWLISKFYKDAEHRNPCFIELYSVFCARSIYLIKDIKKPKLCIIQLILLWIRRLFENASVMKKQFVRGLCFLNFSHALKFRQNNTWLLYLLNYISPFLSCTSCEPFRKDSTSSRDYVFYVASRLLKK